MIVIGILASRADSASMTIARELLCVATGERPSGPLVDRYQLDDAELVVVDELHIDLESVDDRYTSSPAWIAVVSRHAGDTGPLLTAHFPGNIDRADYGGTPRMVPPACPRVLTAYLDAISEEVPTGYEVGIECTHHGPTETTTPILFVEVGSAEPQWGDRAAASAVATALWSIRSVPAYGSRQLVGLGGGHYAPRFERIIRDTSWDVGHIAPDWGLEELTTPALAPVLRGLFEASRAEYCLIEGDYPALDAAVSTLGFRVVGERWLRATSQLSIEVVDALSADLSPVDAGLVIGAATVDDPTEYRIIELSPSLLAECTVIDSERTVAAIEQVSVAYTLHAEGSTPTGELAIPADTSLETMLSTLDEVLAEKYDEVERTTDRIVLRRNVFDRAAANAIGIPEGPLFGRLAAGESIEFEGQLIDPADVTTERTVTYELPPHV